MVFDPYLAAVCLTACLSDSPQIMSNSRVSNESTHLGFILTLSLGSELGSELVLLHYVGVQAAHAPLALIFFFRLLLNNIAGSFYEKSNTIKS